MIKRVCIFGVGGLGGYYGGTIARVFAADRVAGRARELYFVARGEHLREIQQHGLILNTPEVQGLVCKPTKAVEDYAELPAPDLILLCVKGCDLAGAVQTIAKNCKETTYIISLMNGVDIYERVRKQLDMGYVFPTCVYIASSIEKPGTVTKIGGPCLIHFGKDPLHPELIPHDLFAFFDEMGFAYQWHEECAPAIWEKYLFVAAFALVSARYQKNFGEILCDETARQTVRHIMHEVLALSVAAGVTLRESIIEDLFDRAYSFPPDTKTSYQRDLERGAPGNEGELLGGTIIRMGKQYGVPTPVTEQLYQAIKARTNH